MSEKPKDSEDAGLEEIARRARSGEDVSEHFSGSFQAKQRVNVDFPLGLLRAIDAECARIGVTLQAWIKMVCDDRLRRVREDEARQAS